MADNKSKTGKADRQRVAGNQPYEVQYVAKKTGATKAAVKKAIQKVGNQRTKVERELKKK